MQRNNNKKKYSKKNCIDKHLCNLQFYCNDNNFF